MAILFSDVVRLLHQIASIKAKRGGQTGIREAPTPIDIFRRWISCLERATPQQGLLVFRLIFPEHEVRRRYGLGETLLARELHKALNLGSSRALDCWMGAPSSSCSIGTSRMHEEMDPLRQISGCFGSFVEACLAPRRRDRCLDTSASHTLERIDVLLDELASHCDFSCNEIRALRTRSTGSDCRPRAQSDILHDLFEPLSAIEAGYLSQIILRDLSPLLYPLPSASAESAPHRYNANAYQTFELVEALREWNWILPVVYRYRADLDRAFLLLQQENVLHRDAYTQSERRDLLRRVAVPQIGTRIEIPKADKGRSCRAVADICHSATPSGRIYLETKYDGERMQIHVDVSRPTLEGAITIFSKSKRDSTMDRIGTHPMILAALGLPFALAPTAPPSAHLLRRIGEAASDTRDLSCRRQVHTVVLEAEMVAYNEENETIDEFAFIPECAQAAGSRRPACGRQPAQTDMLDSSQTTESQRSAALSGNYVPARHLALVFYDVLSLNGQSLVFDAYEQRRAVLETLVRSVEGYVMLAQRTCIDFAVLGYREGYQRLIRTFAKCIVDRQEGLMIKPALSAYNDSKRGQRWLKLKRDYIPGLGDTASFCIVGASWDKERGRELRVPTSCFTTFHIGVLQNARELDNGTADRPSYLVLFTVSYLASRDMLIQANNRIIERGGVDKQSWMSRLRRSWSFDMSISDACKDMSFVLTSPLVFELYGAGFTRSRGSAYYELRFPRVSAIHHARLPGEAVALEELQAMGRDASHTTDSEAEETVDDLWSRYSSVSGESGTDTDGEGASNIAHHRASQRQGQGWRAKQEQEWVEKLMKADAPKKGRNAGNGRKRKYSSSGPMGASIIEPIRSMRADPHRKTGGAVTEASAPLPSPASVSLIGSAEEMTTSKRARSPARALSESGSCLESPRPCSLPQDLLGTDVTVTSPLTRRRSLIVPGRRSSSFVEFSAPIPATYKSSSPRTTTPRKYLWTVYPKHEGVPVDYLAYAGGVNWIGTLLRRAGYTRKEEGLEGHHRSTSRCRGWTEAIVFTAPGHVSALVTRLRNEYVPASTTVSLPVVVVDSRGLHELGKCLTMSTDVHEMYRITI